MLSRTTKGTSLNASGSKRNQIAQPGSFGLFFSSDGIWTCVMCVYRIIVQLNFSPSSDKFVVFEAFIILNKFSNFHLLYLVFSFSGAAVNVQRKIEFSGAAVSVQRKIESKASSGNTRSAQKNSKAGPANTSSTVGTSIRQARRNVVRT